MLKREPEFEYYTDIVTWQYNAGVTGAGNSILIFIPECCSPEGQLSKHRLQMCEIPDIYQDN